MNDTPYPTSWDEADRIGDAEKWLNGKAPEDVASELNNLHAHQLEWLSYVSEDEEIQAVLQGEMEDRDVDKMYGEHLDRKPSRTEDDNSSGRGGRADVWDSGLQIFESFEDLAEHKIGARSLEQYAKQELGIEKNKVIVPEEVRKICKSIQEEVNSDYGGDCEFGVLFKGEWTDEGFKVQPDYVIPEQKASRAHITYEEDLKKYRDEGYIVNAHSHPWAGESSGFSGTDDDHINSHFDVAILYAGGAETIADAVANVEVEDGATARISPEVEVQSPNEDLPEVEGVDNVTTRSRRRKRKKSSSGTQRKNKKKRVTYGGYRGPHGWGNYNKNLPESPDETDKKQRTFST